MPANDAARWAHEGVDLYATSMGRKAAVARCARDARLTPRRLEAILYGEVRRLWADEYLALRDAYARWCHEGRERLAARVQQMDAMIARLEGE